MYTFGDLSTGLQTVKATIMPLPGRIILWVEEHKSQKFTERDIPR